MEFVTWEHCYCGEGCLSNCLGQPTIWFLLLFFGILMGLGILLLILNKWQLKKIQEVINEGGKLKSHKKR